jgi:hypothetical protein
MKLVRSPNPEKKWRAEFDDGTHTDFGLAGANDYTLTGDKDARMMFRIRHKKDLRTREYQPCREPCSLQASIQSLALFGFFLWTFKCNLAYLYSSS